MHIIHLSDIHIRAGNQDKSRYEEYVTVFNRLFLSVGALPHLHESLIIITGDLFHHKNKVEPYALKLALYLLSGLAPLAPVYLIRGNHDYRQDIPHELDMISALMSHSIPNVTYLDKTGTYYHGQVGMGLVAIQDTLLYGSTSGIAAELPMFPCPNDIVGLNDIECKYKIALFHGTISGTKMSSATGHSLHGYPIDWFQGFDAILLGDIHLQQVHRCTPTVMNAHDTIALPHTLHLGHWTYPTSVDAPWAYPGSLVQQDFGESIMGHGYLVWNLAERTIDAFHVQNTHGFLKLHKELPYRLEELPENLRIHITSIDCSTDSMIQQIKDSGKTILFIKTSTESQHASEEEHKEKEKEAQEAIVRINSIHVLIDYIENLIRASDHIMLPKGLESSVWQSWLQHPERLLISTAGFPETLVKKAADRAEKVQKAARQYLDDFERTAAHHRAVGTFHIHSLQWNWILNYKGGNYYDFDSSHGTIAILNAKNGAGKSNFLEIICIALFGEGFPSRENSNYSAGIICDKKPDGFSPNTTIVFSVHGVKYKLMRIMRTNTVVRLINYDKIILSIIEEEDGVVRDVVLHQQTKAVHGWLDTNLGSLETYLMTAMLSQNADRDFFAMDKTKQKNLLDGIMSLDHITSLKTFLTEAVKYYKYVCDLIEAYQGGITLGFSTELIQQLEEARIIAAQSSATCAALKAHWDHVSERELQSVDIEAITVSYSQNAEHLLHTVNTANTDVTIHERLSELDKDLLLYRGLLAEYQGHEMEDGLETPITINKLHKNRLHLAHLRSLLEEHPFFKERGLVDKTEDAEKETGEEEAEEEEADDSVELAQASRDIEQWMAMKHIEFADIAQTDIPSLMDTATQYAAKLKVYPATMATYQKQVKASRKKYLLARHAKEEHQEARPNRPRRDTAWLQVTAARLQETATTESLEEQETRLSEAIQTIPLLVVRIQGLSHTVSTMQAYVRECADTPFNARCKACRAQPWKKTYDEYVAALPALQAEWQTKKAELASVCDESFDIEHHEDYVHGLEETLARLRAQMALHHEYHLENTLHVAYDAWSSLYDTLCRHCDATDQTCEELDDTCKTLEEEIARITAEKHTLDTQLAQFRFLEASYNAYQAELAVKQQTLANHSRKIRNNWVTLLQEYRRYVSYLVVFLKKHVAQLEAEQEGLLTQQKAVQRAAELQSLMNAYPAWQQWRAATAELQSTTLLVRELETKCGSRSEKAGIDLEGMKETMSVIGYLADKFDGYREWLYKGHIGPLMETHVNRVLAVICEDRPLQLEAEWLDKIHTLSWFVRDGASRPVIEKASGFQRFIVGIAMRVAFHQIGFCRLRCDQLFIDEGFTSCDAENLERVPAFLRGLLSQYDSIYLATHLEELKGCSTVQICIQRDEEGLSQIRTGGTDAIAAAVEEPPKKKGRPAKNKMNAMANTIVNVVKAHE